MVVGDSNTDALIPNWLHATKEVRKLKRSTCKEAEENVARCSNPDQVTDIVVHLGSNDMRKGASAREVKEGIKKVQDRYKKTYHKARFHISALPPREGAQEANFHLRGLAGESKSNFVSLKGMKDRRTQKFMAGMIQDDGHQLTRQGTRILAQEVKRSLYSKANMVQEKVSMDIASLTRQFAAILSQK